MEFIVRFPASSFQLPASSFQLPVRNRSALGSPELAAGDWELAASSYFLSERVAQAVEHEIRTEEEHDRDRAEQQQQGQVAERPLEEEDLLEGDADVRPGVELQESPRAFRRVGPRVGLRR